MATGSFIHRFQSGGTAIQQFASPREIIQTGDPVQFVVSQIRLAYEVASPLNLEIFILDLEGLAFLLTRQLATTPSIVSLEIFADRLRLAADQRIRVGLGRALVEGEFLDVLIGYEYQSLLGPTVDWERIENRPTYEELVGPPGNAAEISIGAVTTGLPGSSASVTNSGTTDSVILDFAIPRGHTGSDATVTNQAVISALGYSPANKAGDTFAEGIASPTLTLSSPTAATSTTTGALQLDGIGMGAGAIYANRINLNLVVPSELIALGNEANAAVDLSILNSISTTNPSYRFGRRTNTTGIAYYDFYRGNNTTSTILRLGSDNTTGAISFFLNANVVYMNSLPASPTGLAAGQLYKNTADKTIRYV